MQSTQIQGTQCASIDRVVQDGERNLFLGQNSKKQEQIRMKT